MYAGREVARALALGSLQPHDCTSDLSGLSDAQLAALADKRISIAKAYEEVGRVRATARPAAVAPAATAYTAPVIRAPVSDLVPLCAPAPTSGRAPQALHCF